MFSSTSLFISSIIRNHPLPCSFSTSPLSSLRRLTAAIRPLSSVTHLDASPQQVVSAVLDSNMGIENQKAVLVGYLNAKDQAIASKDQAIASQDQAIASQDQVLESQKGTIKSLNGELLKTLGLFSVRGMLEYVEQKVKDEYLLLPAEERLSKKHKSKNCTPMDGRRCLYVYVAKQHGKKLTEQSPTNFGRLLQDAYQNISAEIHSGKRSSAEVSSVGDKIPIRQSDLVTYDQCLAIVEIAKFYQYPYELVLKC